MNGGADHPVAGSGLAQRLLPAYIVVLAALYLLQARSPLRINTDSYRLLSMAVSAYEGNGYLVDGEADQFPVGYPLVVRAMLQAGLATSMALVLLNLLCLMVGLWTLYRWSTAQNAPFSAALGMAFVLSSWVMVKHVTLPLTEFLYLGISWLSLFFVWRFYRETGLCKWRFFAVSTVLAYLSLQCRSVGLTLFPVLVITAFLHRDHSRFLRAVVRDWKRALGYTSGAALLSLLALAITLKTAWYETQFARDGSYFQSLLGSAGDKGIASELMQNVLHRILEFGEIFANLPHNKFPWVLPILYLAGLAAWLAVVRGAWLLFRRRDSLPMPLYFLSYSALMLVWPYYDTRFWLPLLPVVAVMLLQTLKDLQARWPVVRFVSRSYLACFFLFGLAALAFSTRMSLSGREFSELYGDGTAKMTYRYAFQNGRPVDRSSVSDDHVRILRIFEPLASSRQAEEKGQPGIDHAAHDVSLATGPWRPGAPQRRYQAVRRLPEGWEHANSQACPYAPGPGELPAAKAERDGLIVARHFRATTTGGAPAALGSP